MGNYNFSDIQWHFLSNVEGRSSAFINSMADNFLIQWSMNLQDKQHIKLNLFIFNLNNSLLDKPTNTIIT